HTAAAYATRPARGHVGYFPPPGSAPRHRQATKPHRRRSMINHAAPPPGRPPQRRKKSSPPAVANLFFRRSVRLRARELHVKDKLMSQIEKTTRRGGWFLPLPLS